MKDTIREYFSVMLEEGFDIESAKDNLLEIIEEIASEFDDKEVCSNDVKPWEKY